MRDAREGCDFNQGGFGSDIFMILLCDDFYSGLQISPCVAVLAPRRTEGSCIDPRRSRIEIQLPKDL